MDKGNVDKHRRSMSGLKVEETEKWGTSKAYQRYGKPQYLHGAPSPPDRSMPQGCGDPWSAGQRGPDWADDHPKDWVRGFGRNGVESAEGKPGFDKSKR